MTLEQLDGPPINEVVCGFVFDRLPLDPLLVGTYWNTRREDFPNRDVHPPISDSPMVFRGLGPVRSWLISESQEFLVQIQPDRFYLNWRRRTDDYPRFNDHEGKSPGILHRALAEFEKFSAFCKGEVEQVPVVQRVDLAKIDLLVEGQHWNGLEDLSTMIPWLSSFAKFSKSGAPTVALRFSEQRDKGRLVVTVDTGSVEDDKGESITVIKIESRLAAVDAGNPKDAFRWANGELNAVFDALIPKDQRDKRFR